MLFIFYWEGARQRRVVFSDAFKARRRYGFPTVDLPSPETKLCLPMRKWVKNRNSFLGELLCCGYCLGHWVAFGLVAIYRPKLFDAWCPMDYFLTALVIAWLAAFQWALMCWLMQKAGK